MSSPEPKDQPFRVPDPSRCPDREHSLAHNVPPLCEGFRYQDRPRDYRRKFQTSTSCSSQDPGSLKSSNAEPEDILDPDLSDAPDLPPMCLARLEEQETAPLILPTLRDMFPLALNSPCTMSPPLSSRFVEETLENALPGPASAPAQTNQSWPTPREAHRPTPCRKLLSPPSVHTTGKQSRWL